LHALWSDSADPGTPSHAHTAIGRVVKHEAVESGAPQAKTGTLREISLHHCTGVAEPDTAERMAAGRGEVESERASPGQAIGHDAFAASLVDRWDCAVCQSDIEAALPGGDSTRETCRPAANYEKIGSAREYFHPFSFN